MSPKGQTQQPQGRRHKRQRGGHNRKGSKPARRQSRRLSVRLAARGARRYKQLFLWLPWPLRIVLVVVSAVLVFWGAIFIYTLVAAVFGAIVVLTILWLAGRSGSRSKSNWQREDDQYMQDMFDAEQRQHEDEGRV